MSNALSGIAAIRKRPRAPRLLGAWTPRLVIAPSRAGELRLRLRLHAVDALCLDVQQLAAADLSVRRPQALFRAVVEPALADRLQQSLLLQRLLRDPALASVSPSPSRSTSACKGEAVWRTIFLYPLAVSFVVTGTVWSWLYSPDAGIEFLVRSLGWHDFTFRLTTSKRHRDLCDHRHRHLAVLRLRDGAVPRRVALGRSRPRQGGADRRRRPCAHLSQGDPARRSGRSSSRSPSSSCSSPSRHSISWWR